MMKLSSIVLLAFAFTATTTATSAVTTTTIRSAAAKASLLRLSRRLDDNNQNQNNGGGDEEYGFLANFALKLVGCSTGEQWQNPEDGEREFSTVVYRLCPKDECDGDTKNGCSSGYGDYVVGINTFVEAWLEDKRENMQQDDNFNIDEFSECREYENENDNGNNNYQQYYVGPTCDGSTGIKLGFFSDYMCTTVPEDVTFEDISNGWSLPYSDGGLIGSGCEDCYGYNGGEYELKEMCVQLYEFSGKCETEMDKGNYYSKIEKKCDYIHEIAPVTAPSSGSNVGAIIGWTILVLVLVGGAFFAYTKWWLKKKEGGGAAEMTPSEGVVS